MHPILFEFNTPDFLQFLLPAQLKVHGYGFMIALGTLLGFLFMSWQLKKRFDFPMHKVADLTILLLLAGFVGGKVLFYLEDPGVYLAQPSRMFQNLGKGFVFYGSLIFCVATLLVYLKKQHLPVLPVLDITAITTCVVHAFGRMGCFLAGCCYGIPHEQFPNVTFVHTASLAKPLGTPLHPTQLYDMSLVASIGLILFWFKGKKQFEGQVFLLYIMLYALGRSVVEIFRGDVQRGFIIEGWLSHSQFIAALMIAVAVYFYIKLKRADSK